MISIQDQQNLLIQIANKIEKEMTVYAIGGTAMMFLGFKEATQDVDLVFANNEDRKEFKNVALSLGYKEMNPTIVYGVKNNCPQMIKLGDARLDLFSLDVIDFKFSQSMQERSKQVHQFGDKLFLRVADVHDIILMKCATRRVKDENDIINILNNSKIDLNILVQEAKNQLNLGKECAVVDIGNLLEKLKNKHKIDIPASILDDIWSLVQQQIKEKGQKEKEEKLKRLCVLILPRTL